MNGRMTFFQNWSIFVICCFQNLYFCTPEEKMKFFLSARFFFNFCLSVPCLSALGMPLKVIALIQIKNESF